MAASNPEFEKTVKRNQRGEFTDKVKTAAPTVGGGKSLPYEEESEPDYGKLTPRKKRELAGDNNAPTEVLERLAADDAPYVRALAAGNPNTPLKLLRRLSKDSEPLVRGGVARNRNTPVTVLNRLAKDKAFRRVRAEVARNPNTPAETLDKLSRDKQGNVLIGVANNPSTPTETLLKLAKHDYPHVCYYAKESLDSRSV